MVLLDMATVQQELEGLNTKMVKIVVLAMVVEVLSVKLTWDDNLHQFRSEPEETSLRMRACWKERGKGASRKSGSRNLP